MPTCIYCRETKERDGFRKAEHVLPRAFGGFRDNLTLHGVVCDACNKYFGDHLEQYLARDTPDGLNRFRFGVKPVDEYASLGKRSSMEIHIQSGRLAGARAVQRHVDGQLVATPLPQIGFGKTLEGPFRWFLIDQLPSKEELRQLVQEGFDHVEFCEISDREAALAQLHRLGAQTSDLTETDKAGHREGAWSFARYLGMTLGAFSRRSDSTTSRRSSARTQC